MRNKVAKRIGFVAQEMTVGLHKRVTKIEKRRLKKQYKKSKGQI